ncbi:hypothetical protein CI610_01590 [invertebrate metagenome]|uniref:Autotransporter domain-containing protein n=1 Tax=invertebrate metagenome TaxID=1711999 RepID=A0A2H9T8A7_9ZZZZ
MHTSTAHPMYCDSIRIRSAVGKRTYLNQFAAASLALAISSVVSAGVITVSSPVDITDSQANSLLVDETISVSQSIIKVSGHVGSIVIENAMSTSSGDAITISGALSGVIQNQAVVTGPVRITGSAKNTSGINGTGAVYFGDANGILDGGIVIGGGSAEAEVSAQTDHTLLIGSAAAESGAVDAYVDSIQVALDSELSTLGEGKSAVYVGASGQAGGIFEVPDADPANTIAKSESDTVLDIDGTVFSENGAAITLAGASTGKIAISGTVEGKDDGTVAGAAIVISGNHTGAIVSDGADGNESNIIGGIVVTGTMRSTESPLQAAIDLGKYSETDFILIDGGSIESADTAIDVEGNFSGDILLKGGELIAGSDTDYAINFSSDDENSDDENSDDENSDDENSDDENSDDGNSEADKDLNFIQSGSDARTVGSIMGSNDVLDTVEILGGSFRGNEISEIETLVVSSAADITITGTDFTLPAEVTVKIDVEDLNSFESTSPIIVTENSGFALTIPDEGSDITVEPASANAYEALANDGDGVTLTFIEYNSYVGRPEDVEAELAELDMSVQQGANVLLNVTPEFTEDSFNLKVEARDPEEIASSLMEAGASERESILWSKAVEAIKNPKDTEKAALLYQHLKKLTDEELIEEGGNLFPLNGQSSQIAVNTKNLQENIISGRLNRNNSGLSGMPFGDSYYEYHEYEEELFDGGIWGQMLYGEGEFSQYKKEPEYNSRTYGGVLGFDREYDSYTLGVAGSWTRTTAKGDKGKNNKTEPWSRVDNIMTTFYTSWQRYKWYIDTLWTLGYGDNDTEYYKSDGEKVTASYDSVHWGTRLIASYRMGNHTWSFIPQFELNYAHINAEKYKEKGASSGYVMEVDPEKFEVFELGGGFRLNKQFHTSSSMIQPGFSLMGYFNLNHKGAESTVAYLAGGDEFTVTGPERDDLRLKAGFTLDVEILDSWTLSAAYYLDKSDHFESTQVSAKARYDF